MEQIRLAQKLDRWAWIVSGVVLLAVVLMRQFKIATPIDFSFYRRYMRL